MSYTYSLPVVVSLVILGVILGVLIIEGLSVSTSEYNSLVKRFNVLLEQKKLLERDTPNGYISPCHRIGTDDVKTYEDKTIIERSGIMKGTVTSTGSMRPTISDYSTILYSKPSQSEVLCVGDIASYSIKTENRNCVSEALHRVTSVNRDAFGKVYYTFQGDNNRRDDGCPIYHENIDLVAVGVLW